MGIEIEVNSLEDMCALMCDNRIPKRRKRVDECISLPRDKVKAICEALVNICNHECCDYGHGDAVDYAESLLDNLNQE